MLQQTKAKIFLAGERGLSETDWFRSYTTFNFGSYQNEYKTPVGPLYVLNDETLAGGHQAKYLVEEDSLIVLLPVVGTIVRKTENEETFLQAGEAQVIYCSSNSAIEIANPYETELVNYLQLWFRYSANADFNKISSFDLTSTKNELINFFNSEIKLNIGKFDGRSEAIYHLSRDASAFVFVIQGAFEVQNRLLEAKDGLALENVKEVEMEALSNDAILLIIEVP